MNAQRFMPEAQWLGTSGSRGCSFQQLSGAVLLTTESCRIGETLMAGKPNEITPDFRRSTALTRSVSSSANDVLRTVASQSNRCDIASIACGYTWVNNYGTQSQTDAGTYWNQMPHPWGSSTLYGYSRRFVWFIGIKTQVDWRGLTCADIPTSGTASGAGGCVDWVTHGNSCNTHKNRVEAEAHHAIVTVYGIPYDGSTNDAQECNAPICNAEESVVPTSDGSNLRTAAASRDCVEDGVGNGSSGVGGASNLVCHTEVATIEISHDGGASWETLWSGPVNVCEYAE